MVDEILADCKVNFDKAIDSFKNHLGKVRTGRASAALLDGIKVEYYGTMTPLAQVGAVNVPDARLITIKPWDKTVISAIERAIQAQSDLGLNPQSDGEIVRIPIPPLTQDRRKDLVKLIKKMSEEAKVVVRGTRRDANEQLKEAQSDKVITEDDVKAGTKKVQDLTDKYIATIDDMTGKKEKEVMDV